jgi:hypothetical protein
MTSTPQIPTNIPPTFTSVSTPTTERWPGVVGYIAVIFGIAGVLQSGCGMAASIFSRQMYELGARIAPQSVAQFEIQQAVNDSHQWMNAALSLLSMLVAVMLLVGGVQLLRRCSSCATLLRAWAGAKLILALLLAGAGWIQFASSLEAMQAAQSQGLPSPAVMRGFGLIGMAITLLWHWALPIFMLIWFSRGSIRASVERWN